ncbi:MAG: FtsX-like permease family protein [Gammaproteobacteria bacterium]
MGASVAWMLATRYLKTRRRQFAAFISWVSLAGLTLGVLVLTVVVSVMNGFDGELKTRILGTVPHVVLRNVERDDPRVEPILAMPDVVSGFEFFMGAGMVTKHGAVNPVSVYGIDPEDPAALDSLGDKMVYGSLADLNGDGHGIVIGSPLASHLGLLPGDTLALILSEPGPSGLEPRIQPFHLVGTFEIGADLDYGLALVDMEDLPVRDLASAGLHGVRLTLTDPLKAPAIAHRLSLQYPGLDIESWATSYGELFQAVRLEKLMMFVILLLVVAVAAFNIVSGQMMVVTDKRSDIAILRTMGASDRTILLTFLLQGVLISGAGILVGLVLGIGACFRITEIVAWMKSWFGFGLLDGTYFVEVPVLIQPMDLVLIGCLSAALCLMSAWIPARRAADQNPIEGLHA